CGVQLEAARLLTEVLLHRTDVASRSAPIDFSHGPPHGGRHRHWLTIGSHDERHHRAIVPGRTEPAILLLKVRDVHHRRGLALKTSDHAVAHDAHDHAGLFVRHEIERDTLPDGILAFPESIGHRLVNDHHQRRCRGVCPRELSSANDRNLHRLEVARRDREVGGALPLSWFRPWPTRDEELHPHGVAAQWCTTDRGGRPHAGDGLDSFPHALVGQPGDREDLPYTHAAIFVDWPHQLVLREAEFERQQVLRIRSQLV